MRLRLFLGIGAILALGVAGSTAFAKAPGGYSCAGGVIPAGTYTNVTVTGDCLFGSGDVIVNGNVTVEKGATLNDHAGSAASSTLIKGNVQVGKGGVFGLGYNVDEGILGPDVVGGNIVAHDPQSLYLGNITVHGNVISNGGSGPGRNFPIKDNVIDGNLILQGWQGQWIGAIRNQVGGNVDFSKNTADDTSVLPGSDSSEVMTNEISGNLVCHKNTPAAQVNPGDGGQPNVVGGNAVGECAGLTTG